MKLEKLKLIEGKQTVKTIAETLSLTRNSVFNLVSKLKKEGYLKGDGRIYTISTRKDNLRGVGMYDLLNKNSKIKVAQKYFHKVIGEYTIEDALVDAVKEGEIRIIHSALYLFNKVKDWKRLFTRARNKGIETEILALYELSRMFTKTRKMPEKYYTKAKKKDHIYIVKGMSSDDANIKEIERKYGIYLPFNKGDLND